MARNNLQVLGVQETKWRGSKGREIGGGYKLYYHGEDGTKHGVGIVLCEELKDIVLAVERPDQCRIKVARGPWHIIIRGAPSPRTCNICHFNGCKITSGGKR